MNIKIKINYELPEVSVIEVAVEKGFAQSPSGQLDGFGREVW